MRKRVLRRSLTINDEKWKVVFRAPKDGDDIFGEINEGDQGLCSYSTQTIYIQPNDEALSTGIHEVLHALFPDLSEAAVANAEQTLMKFLSIFPEELHTNE
jgi:hypothetical protein